MNHSAFPFFASKSSTFCEMSSSTLGLSASVLPNSQVFGDIFLSLVCNSIPFWFEHCNSRDTVPLMSESTGQGGRLPWWESQEPLLSRWSECWEAPADSDWLLVAIHRRIMDWAQSQVLLDPWRFSCVSSSVRERGMQRNQLRTHFVFLSQWLGSVRRVLGFSSPFLILLCLLVKLHISICTICLQSWLFSWTGIAYFYQYRGSGSPWCFPSSFAH